MSIYRWKSSDQEYLVHTAYSFYSDSKWAPGSMVENTLQPSCWRAKAPRESSPSPYRGGGQCVRWSLSAPPLKDSLRIRESPCGFPFLYLVSFLLFYEPSGAYWKLLPSIAVHILMSSWEEGSSVSTYAT